MNIGKSGLNINPKYRNTIIPKYRKTQIAMGDFRQLRVWKKSKDLAVHIYRLTADIDSLSKDFRFKDQMRSAAVSIPSNIAEGDKLDTNKQSIRSLPPTPSERGGAG